MYIFDLDDTLALTAHRQHLIEGDEPDWDAFFLACGDDEPNVPVVQMAKRLFMSADIFIFSGRGEIARAQTEVWLIEHGIPFTELRMRPEGEFMPSDELKAKWLKEVGPENVNAVFDNSAKDIRMFRSHGLLALNVEQNSEAGDFGEAVGIEVESPFMRAKMAVQHVEVHDDGSEQVKMSAVGRAGYENSGDGSDENNTYAKYTPMADLTMLINNPALARKIQENDVFYVDFTESATT